MINIIKFIVLFLYKSIRNNLVKVTLATISFILWTFAGTIPDEKSTITVVDSMHIDGNCQYIYRSVEENKIVYKIYNSDKPKIVTNSKIELSHYNEMNVGLWILFAISTFILFILLLILVADGSRDYAWEWDDSFDYALSWFTKCHMDEKTKRYHYYAFGKLLETSSRSDETVSIGSLRKLKMRPSYEPKTEKRDRLIENILKAKVC